MLRTLLEDLRYAPITELITATDQVVDAICDRIGTSDGVLGFGVRDPAAPVDDPVGGWRSSTISYRRGPYAEHDRRMFDAWYRQSSHLPLDPLVVALARTGGSSRAFLDAEVVRDPRRWRRVSPVGELLEESGIGDRLVGGHTVGPGVELLFAAHRRKRERRFVERQRADLCAVMQVLQDVGPRLARAHGLIDARSRLTPRERQVLHRLLLGLSEPSAAEDLGLTVRSLHQHVVSVYRKLGVASRGELAAHFLEPRFRNAGLNGLGRALDERERTVLEELMRGASEKEIAARTELGARAVHHLVQSIYRKAGVNRRAELLARVLTAEA